MITGRSPARSISAATPPAGRRPKAGDYRIVGQNAPRVDLAAKVFGEPVFVHDMALDGMMHARVVRQPRRGATIRAVDEAALRRAAKGPIEIIRNGNFLAIVGADETVVEAVAAVAPNHVAWDGIDAINPFQEEARWLLQQPSIDRVVGPPPPPPGAGGEPVRGDLHADAHRPCLGGAVLRARPLSRRAAAGVDPFAGGLPAARCAGADLEARSGDDLGQARAGAGLLRPQRRRRRGGRRRGHRAADPRKAGPGALAARGGIRLRAGQPGDGGDGARRARRRRTPGRLDDRNLERPAFAAGPAAAATCSPPRRCPTRRRRRPPPNRQTRRAPAPATASRSTAFRQSASSIT